VRLVTLADATTAGGRSRAQVAAQQARIAAGATEGRVTAFAVGVEATEERAGGPVGELVAHLRGHPRPVGSVTYGGPAVPAWLDPVLREMVGAPDGPGPGGQGGAGPTEAR
jgi:hypothetical protein